VTEPVFRQKHARERSQHVRDLLGEAIQRRCPGVVMGCSADNAARDPQRLVITFADGSQYYVNVSEVRGPSSTGAVRGQKDKP
jgi:hypothetical protein